MSYRKEVFQAKVLQRLYPAPPEEEKVLKSPVRDPEPAASKRVKRKQHKGEGNDGGSGLTGRKVYTVLPPPEDYRPAGGEEAVMPVEDEPLNDVDEKTADATGSDDCNASEVEEPVLKRRRRRRKGHVPAVSEVPPLAQTSSPDAKERAEDVEKKNEEKTDNSERLSKNRRRKMKKKRHKEKLISLGLVPQPRALEFTYQQSPGEEEEDEESREKLDELLEFLRKSWDLYVSDRSSATGDPSLHLSAMESLFVRLSGGTSPPAGASSLCRLRDLLGRRDVEKLKTELNDFSRTSTLPGEEATAVCTLFRYWMTEVLPLQTEGKT